MCSPISSSGGGLVAAIAPGRPGRASAGLWWPSSGMSLRLRRRVITRRRITTMCRVGAGGGEGRLLAHVEGPQSAASLALFHGPGGGAGGSGTGGGVVLSLAGSVAGPRCGRAHRECGGRRGRGVVRRLEGPSSMTGVLRAARRVEGVVRRV
jgi:hypothetical protein